MTRFFSLCGVTCALLFAVGVTPVHAEDSPEALGSPQLGEGEAEATPPAAPAAEVQTTVVYEVPPGYGATLLPGAPAPTYGATLGVAPLTLPDYEYEDRRGTARTSGALLPVFAVATAVGIGLAANRCHLFSEDEPGCGAGISLAVFGFLAYWGTAMTHAITAHRAGRRLRDMGVSVARWPGITAIILSAIPYGALVSWIFARIQMGHNERAYQRLYDMAQPMPAQQAPAYVPPQY